MSPRSPLTQPARPLASCFTMPVTAWCSSSLPAFRATTGHPSFTFPNRGRPQCFTSGCRVSDYVLKCEFMALFECVCVCACDGVCTSFHKGRSNDKMSCDQWAVDRTLLTWWKASPLTIPAPRRPPGQGRPCTKSALYLSGTPQGLLHGPRSPWQHQAY